MMSIWKWACPVADEFFASIPESAKCVHVEAQDGSGCMWWLVDTGSQPIERTFMTVGTGHPVPDIPLEYLGSYQLQDGRFVAHVFEKVDVNRYNG